MNAAAAQGGDHERFLTVREVGERLGLSPDAVLRRIRSGELPAFRLSNRVLRVRESELNAWLEGKREGPPPPPHLRLV